ncbi:Hypothetical protein, putative [Bodo saltans]|uniref:Kinteoplast poly(A) polymerase complex 1 subunit n=1 Tax=Bodo saltans TaxID=75058 RepID=A0A0S4JPP8_BODSA|nr:Hypothetical protein, putative [Bodo saltans]|eukprot:CUG93485.1 Hypothetical protein, putative [Bodo saltans]
MMMLRFTRQLAQGRVPSAGSSLRNPQSFRSKQRRAIALGQATLQQEETVLGDSGMIASSVHKRAPAFKSPRGKFGRKNDYSHKMGKDLADRALSMTDNEWEQVPLPEKHSFTRYISKMLKDHPTMVTEQQRRRYFETTLVDPRDLNPHKTVKDTYERIKLGLPVTVKDPERQLGVSQAMYEAAEANMFDPDNAHVIENAMTHVKQVFVDYVRKKKQGLSTEAERRELARLMTDLNHQTQQHLANMFKYADAQLIKLARDEREKQVLHMREIAASLKQQSKESARNRSAKKKERIRDVIRNTFGLDAEVAGTILTNLRAQERFLELCEVMLRLTSGVGFHHSKNDESLDAYITNLRNLYSMDPAKFATVDLVRFMAAQEHTMPLDWAKRWYEKALLLPLQETEEYKALRRVQKDEEEKARVLISEDRYAPKVEDDANAPKLLENESAISDAANAQGSNSDTLDEATKRKALVAIEVASAARNQTEGVIRLVDKMFLRPDDSRLASVHEKRLRYLAFVQLERQIERAREHAKRFEGIEALPEAERCRELYQKIQERRNALEQSQQQGTEPPVPCVPMNVFEDAEVRQYFAEIQSIAKETIRALNRQNAADRKAEQISRILSVLKGGDASSPDGGGITESPAEQAKRLLEERKSKAMSRILNIVEKDVKEDVEWIDNLAEADRPPLLPIPEPMSYVSAEDIMAWKETRDDNQLEAGNPFKKRKSFQPSLMGMPWQVPDKPILFWGTGVSALHQGLQHAAEDAERRRKREPLAPPYPCPENPWGWKVAEDILDL